MLEPPSCVTYGPGYFLASQRHGRLFRTETGSDKASYYAALPEMAAMHYAENTWIGVGLDDQTIYTSDDAVYWVKRYAAADALKDVTFGNGTFVAVGDNGLVLQSAVILKEALRISGTDSPSLRLTMLRGRHYRLESSPDLEAWELVQEFTGSGATEDIDVIPASDKAFYRLTLSGD